MGLALGAGLMLGACGFTPAYGPDGAARDLLGRVEVDPPGSREEFDLVARLEERLGRPQAAQYRLSFRVEIAEEGQAISQTNETNRYQVIGAVSYTLRDRETGRDLSSGRVRGFTAYSATGTAVASVASRRDARARLMRLLADRIVTRLIATAPEWNRP
ncbi:LPS-assembly lipoprotein [Albidovulum inexpectatum]|uniref:LPS-assembly lipoprotein n=1 Tax=Albidovulum inexpectatum TaxID=196587 RepID=A0A2S5JEF7_9RHOB|nr:LPS assembly lipoprotein LptE [Albidovulum inexpectatum]PPB79685.1 LPS-assembly lipoprotein [Albidovulum inexpectatum]